MSRNRPTKIAHRRLRSRSSLGSLGLNAGGAGHVHELVHQRPLDPRLTRRDLLSWLAHLSLLPLAVELSRPAVAEAEELPAFASFEDEMMAHCKKFAPEAISLIGKRSLRGHVERSIARAREYGFTLRGPIRTFIEMTFIFGTSFDDDPAFPWAQDILRNVDRQTEEMKRAEALYEWTMSFQERVPLSAMRKALAKWYFLGDRIRPPAHLDEEGFGDYVREEMTWFFPEKLSFAGRRNIDALISRATREAPKYGPVSATADGRALIVGLYYGFGRGCLDDPLMPMIGEAVRSAGGVDEARTRLRAAIRAVAGKAVLG